MSLNSDTGSLFKVGVMFILVAAVTAASVGLLVQHRKLDELNRDHGKQAKECAKIVAENHTVKVANETLAENLKKLHEALGKCENERDALRREVKQRLTIQLSSLTNDLAAAKAKCNVETAARKRAEAEVKKLKESVKKLNESVKALKKEIKDLLAERDALEHELISAMQPVDGESPAKAAPAVPAPAVQQEKQPELQDPDDILLIRQPPPEDNLTPEEREARKKAELDELIGL